MNCSSCGFEIRNGFAFCPKCGAKQPAACAGCGYLCAPDFAFCPQCGVPVAGARQDNDYRPQPAVSVTTPPQKHGSRSVETEPGSRQTFAQADRRTVTVLFADLSGFTTLSERLDPEVVQDLQNELFEQMTAAVHRFGGFVDKFIGDALLALFGAPAAHEDDPERALRAALDMIERTGHALKGSSGNMGATGMASLGAALQGAGQKLDVAGARALIEEMEAEFTRVRGVLENAFPAHAVAA